MTQPELTLPPPWVDPDQADEVIRDLGKEIAERFWQTLDDTFPNGNIPTLRIQVGKDALRSFLTRTALSDRPYLLEDPKYLEKYRHGIYPMLVSPYWQGLMAAPPYFEKEQAQFRRLWHQYVEDPS